MNIALEKCEEHVNGVKKRSYGDAFIRGNNGTPFTSLLSPLARPTSQNKMVKMEADNSSSYVHLCGLSSPYTYCSTTERTESGGEKGIRKKHWRSYGVKETQ